jgi:hypothetical protein
MLVAALSPFAAIELYFARVESALSYESVMRNAGILSGAWIASVVLFLLIIRKGYRHTFFSLKTGHEWAKEYFDEGNDDSLRHLMYSMNSRMWKSIRPQYKQYLADNWSRWEKEQPE